MAFKDKIIVERIMDDIINHSFELQRVSNGLSKKLKREFNTLTKKLESISGDYDFSRTLPRAKRQAMRGKLLARAKKAIKESHKALEIESFNQVVRVGNFETNFATGSINKHVTGKGTIAFAGNSIPKKRISTIAKGLIIKGAPQAKWWARQSTSLQNKFSDMINDAWLNNQDIATVSQRIRGTSAANFKDGLMAIPKNQADALARTSIASISNQVREETYLANQDVIKGAQFLAVLDSQTSEICTALNGDKWIMEGGGWRNIEGGHDYRSPPLHFNCRSTMIPLLKEPRELAKDKLAQVPKKKRETLGEIIGPKVCHSPCKYQDADLWLQDQPVAKQKDILGARYGLWLAGNHGKKPGTSVKRVVTQNGRVRTVGEMERIASKAGILLDDTGVESLKTLETFTARKTVKDLKYRTETEELTKARFLGIERKIIAGEKVSKDKRDLIGRIFINAEDEALEYADKFKPSSFRNMLGSQEKQIAFYNHIAKNFEKQPKWRRGYTFEKRYTGSLSDNEKELLSRFKEKITRDAKISAANKRVLLTMLDEGSQIIGTRRIMPAINSLVTLARKSDIDFKDIKNIKGYVNQSMSSSINQYFTDLDIAAKRVGSAAGQQRLSFVSSTAREYSYLNTARAESALSPKVSLVELRKVHDEIKNIGKRKLRDHSGANVTPQSVKLGLKSNNQTIEMYLGYLQDVDIVGKQRKGFKMRMSSEQVEQFVERVKPAHLRKSMTASEKLHLERVEFLVNQNARGDVIELTNAMLKSPLFKEWDVEDLWQGRGLSSKLKKDIGQVLTDAQTYSDLEGYLASNLIIPAGELPASFVSKAVDDYFKVGANARKTSRKAALTAVEDLSNVPEGFAANFIKSKNKVQQARQQKEADRLKRKIDKDRKALAEGRKAKAEQGRLEVLDGWEEQADAKFIINIRDALNKTITSHAYDPKKEFYTVARQLKGVDPEWLAQFTNKELFGLTHRNVAYGPAIKKLGEKFLYKTRGILDPDVGDAERIGHFLLLNAEKTKIIKRVKQFQPGKDGKKGKITWMIKVTDDDWADAILANKNNYDIEGLPSLGEVPKIGADGLYEDGTSLIRTGDKKWAADQVKNNRKSEWVKNIENETATGIKVNDYVYETMRRLEKIGDDVIPTKTFSKGKDGIKQRSKRQSYDRTTQVAGNVRGHTFYNKLTLDKYGRTYSDTMGLHWQGDDISKGLMKFAKSEKLGDHGYQHFSRVWANTAGFDKIPMKYRVQLLDRIDDDLILKTIDDPIRNNWWRKKTNWVDEGILTDFSGMPAKVVDDIKELARAMDPSDEGAFQFLALLKERAEMIKFTRAGNRLEDFKSSLSMPMDGTTNVLQHGAAITRDVDTAVAVNMTKTDDVQDAYMVVRRKLDDMVKTDPAAKALSKYLDLPEGTPHSLRRKSVKHGLMTNQYNAGAPTLGKQYVDAAEKGFKKLYASETDPVKKAEWYRAYKAFHAINDGSKEGKRIISRIGHQVKIATDIEFPAGLEVRRALGEFADMHKIADTAITVDNIPTGFPFRQQYKITRNRQTNLAIGNGKTINVTYQIELDIIKQVQQRTAFAPNYIHAMDAAHKSLTVNIAKKICGTNSYSMIHDSFGTHAGKSNCFLRATKLAMKHMYKDKNIFKEMMVSFRKQGIAMKKFIRNPDRATPSTLVSEFKTFDEVPEYLREYYKQTRKGTWKYKGEVWTDPASGKLYPIREFTEADLPKLGDYDFKDLDDSEYFFH